MEPVYRIAKWDDVYERSESRKLKSLSWIAFPVDLGSRGYLRMVGTFGDKAPMIYGAWAALVSVAAGCSRRGTLAHSNGDPMTLFDVAMKSRFPLPAIEMMFAWASSKDVCWIELAEPAGEWTCDPPEISQDAGEIPRIHDTTEHDITLPDKTRPTDTTESACGRAGEVSPGVRIVMGPDQWREITPLMHRIARVVTKNGDIRATQLRDGDYDLCCVAAALATYRFGTDWLDPILKSISDRTDAADKPWGHFRGCLVKATKRRGEDFHDAEALVNLPKRPPKAPAADNCTVAT